MLKINSTLFEKDLIDKYSDIFHLYNKKMQEKMDLLVCDSCFQMTQRSKLKIIHSTDIHNFQNEILCKLLKFHSSKNENFYFCNQYCWPDIIDFNIPKFSKLNNMQLNDPPEEIKILNCYETILIQLAKSFQTIVKLSPLKQSRYTNGISALKGERNYYKYFNSNINMF
jgi:hypothetical protein